MGINVSIASRMRKPNDMATQWFQEDTTKVLNLENGFTHKYTCIQRNSCRIVSCVWNLLGFCLIRRTSTIQYTVHAVCEYRDRIPNIVV